MLSRREAEAVYDRTGRWQDTQAIYERVAIDAMIAHGDCAAVSTLFEVGCGTGRVAERLLSNCCPSDTRYVGVDLSTTMVEIARKRLQEFGGRATVRRTEGAFSFDVPASSQDRVMATYVLDLLSADDIEACLAEAHRLLAPNGRLWLAGLTWGERPLGRLVSASWAAIHRVRPEWVGGCRPLRLGPVLDDTRWVLKTRTRVRSWGVPSEVLIAAPA